MEDATAVLSEIMFRLELLHLQHRLFLIELVLLTFLSSKIREPTWIDGASTSSPGYDEPFIWQLLYSAGEIDRRSFEHGSNVDFLVDEMEIL